MRERVLTWDGCINARDLGGHPTEDGGVTRFGAVVRADSVRKLSDEGWAALVAYGIRTVVDLRTQSELDTDPPRELAVEAVHVSVLPGAGSPHWPEIDAIGDAAPDAASATRDVYLAFLERFHDRFAEAVAAVARAPDGGVLVHCLGGKDRTGLVTALLLRLAAVPPAEIGSDYAASERNLVEFHERWIADAEDDRERDRRRRISACPPSAMVGVLAELERRYGSARSYLVAGGATDADVERVRARLRA